MRTLARFWTGGLVAACVLGLFASARAQEAGPEHKILANDVGTWDATMKFWMDPEGDPTESKGVETNTLMPGGLWLLTEFKGEVLGSEFHGRGQTGYDTFKKKYVGTWIDSMTTGIMNQEGTYDEKTHTVTMTGESFDPAQNKMVKTKSLSVSKPDGTRSMTMYMLPEGAGGKEVKTLEITYKKRK